MKVSEEWALINSHYCLSAQNCITPSQPSYSAVFKWREFPETVMQCVYVGIHANKIMPNKLSTRTAVGQNTLTDTFYAI